MPSAAHWLSALWCPASVQTCPVLGLTGDPAILSPREFRLQPPKPCNQHGSLGAEPGTPSCANGCLLSGNSRAAPCRRHGAARGDAASRQFYLGTAETARERAGRRASGRSRKRGQELLGKQPSES